jgi:uroporphyrinogen III methyltransferase/synthase
MNSATPITPANPGSQQRRCERGIVYLVGAGPGDPGLITVRGLRLLEAAQVVVYDALSDPRLLAHAPQAEAIYVGKRAADHSMTQEQINALLVKLGQEGRRVVRLKGGDPFVFGRGAEECEALRSASVAFEVVPGITAAIAAPCYAGIPVTHRDFNSSFTLITGHEKEEEYRSAESKARGSAAGSSDVDWSALAKLPCMAFYMGVKALPRITTRLVEHGMDPSTPAASIQWGTTSRQRTVVATVSDLAQKVEQANLTPPVMTIIGNVVSLRATMNWFETKPLFGQTIVVTRTRQQASELTTRLEELGAGVLEAPTIEVAPPADSTAIAAALARLHEYDWVIFTSVNGVSQTKRKLVQFGLDARVFGKAKVAVIGDATADAVRDELCLKVDLCPPTFVAEALADELIRRGEVGGRKFLLLRADIARPLLRERLEQAGAGQVNDVAIYETHPTKELPPHVVDAIDAKQVTWVTFTSSSTAKNFIQLLGADYRRKLQGVKLASIGPVTTATLQELGLTPTAQADTFNIDGLVSAIMGTR